jgi:hypothetical protein
MSYNVFGWFDLWRTTDGEGDSFDKRRPAIDAVEQCIKGNTWAYDTRVELRHQNGMDALVVVGQQNRPLTTPAEIRNLLETTVEGFPASHGLLYKWTDDEDLETATRYRVTVVVRGEISARDDPFFSPITPTVFDR